MMGAVPSHETRTGRKPVPHREGRQGRATVLCVPLGVSLLAMAIGWRPTVTRGGQAALEAMFLAQVVLLATIYTTLLRAISKMTDASPVDRFKLAFRAMGERFVVTLVVVCPIAWREIVDPTIFLLWVAIGYIVMSLAETVALARWMRRLENHSCS